MAQASRTRTAGKHAATAGKHAATAGRRAATAGRRAASRWRPGPAVEIGGLVIGIVTGLCLSLGLLSSSPAHHPPAAITRAPLVMPGSAVDPAALNAEWAAYSDRSRCADWAGGDGVSAIRLSSDQLAWFFSDTYLGPAGPATGFSHISGFVNNSVVIQTTVGHASSLVTMTGGGACTGPGRPGRAAAVVAPPAAPGGPSDRYWDEDGIRIGPTVVKFYNRYLAGNIPFVPAGTVIATFPVSQLSAAGQGPAYGAVARPALVPLPSWTPPGGTSPVIWGAALLRAGNTVYVYGTQSPPGLAPGSPAPPRQLYLARVPVSRLTTFSAWRFYAGAGQWAAGQQDARPVQPSGPGVSSGFSVVAIGGRYWLIQAGAEPGGQDIDAYPASEPWGPFDPAAGLLLYRNPAVGLDAAHDYRIMYEARAEPALSTAGMLVISYNVNSEAVTSGCTPMSAYTNTVTQPRFISVPLAAFGSGAGTPRTASAAPGYPRIVPRDPSQWFNAWNYPGGCPPVPGLAAVHARPGPGKVKLTWPDAGLGVRYLVYLQGPTDIPAATAYGDGTTLTGLRPGAYVARVVPVNTKLEDGRSAQTTFVVP